MLLENSEREFGRLVSSKTGVKWDVVYPKILPPLFFMVAQSSTQVINQLVYIVLRVEIVGKDNKNINSLVDKINRIVLEEQKDKNVFRHIKIINISREDSFDNIFGYKKVIELEIIQKEK